MFKRHQTLAVPIALISMAQLGAAAEPTEYQWTDLGAGIYLSSQVEPLRGPIDGNSVVIVTDRDVVVVDTHINPAAARQVIGRIRDITDKKVTWVVNTHWHDDHVYGNGTYRAAFPEATIVAHEATLELAKENWVPSVEQRINSYQRIADVDMEAEADKIEAEDPAKAMMYRIHGQYADALLSELHDIEIVFPDLTFTDSIRLDRGDRTIEIRRLGQGNTEGDAVVWLPEEKILISGDLVVHPVPFAYSVSFREWIQTLHVVEELQPRLLIPGHGDVQHDLAYVGRLIDLFETTVEAVETAAARGLDQEAILEMVTLEREAKLFAGDDPMTLDAFENYYRAPAIKSLWEGLQAP